MAEESVDLEVELDRLYALPAGEFVAWRNQLVKRLRGAGDRDAADRVKKLPRPSQTAWAVNQLAFRANAELEGLRVAGEKVRAAHLAGRSEQQAAAKARRDAIATLRVIAEVALQEAGVSPTRTHRQRITQTLEVLSSRAAPGDREEAEEPRPGRLSIDLEPAGFDALSDLAAALAAAQKARPRVAKGGKEPAATEPVAERSGRPKSRPVSPAGPEKVVEHPAAKRHAEEAARQAAERAAERRELDRREGLARAKLELLAEKIEGLGQEAERKVSELDAAKQTETTLAAAAVKAERLAREARARAEAATGATAQARRDAEAASVARQRAEGEHDQARRELERIDAKRRELGD